VDDPDDLDDPGTLSIKNEIVVVRQYSELEPAVAKHLAKPWLIDSSWMEWSSDRST
jgi:hypothetical protein